MSYLVLARKYRPVHFEEVVGQSHVTTTLQNAIQSNRLANAYLFAGPRGVGKTSVARILAKAINCTNGPTLTPCNECSYCKEIAEGRSLDVLEIDGASNRGIDEVRNLRETLRYAPSPGKYKIYIIDEVHMLTAEAFNALLKTLEEPPKNVLFIFATTEPRRVPPTILSRCQRFDFRRISGRDIIAQLKEISEKEHIIVSDESLHLIAQKADGSMRDGESILDQLVAYSGESISPDQVADILGIIDQELYFECSAIIRDEDSKAALQLTEKIFSEGYDFGEFMTGLAEHFRNILVAKSVGGTDILDVSESHAERYLAAGKEFENEDLLRLIKTASDSVYGIQRADNPRLQLELTLIRMVKMDKTVRISELLDKLDDIKKNRRPEIGRTVSVPAQKTISASAAKAAKRVADSRPQTVQVSSQVVSRQPCAVDIEMVKENWPAVVDEVKRKKIALGFLLQEGVPTRVDGSVVEIAFRRSNGFHMSSVERGREDIENVVSQRLGTRIRVKCVPDTDGVLGDESPNDPRSQRRREFEELMETSPIVRTIVEKFDAELLE